MPFTRPSLITIIARIEADIVSKLTGSVALLRLALLRILAVVFGGSIHTFYGALDWLARQLIVTTAETEWLDKHAFMWSVYRIRDTFASGDVIFTGTDTTVIPLGTVVVRSDGSEFATTVAGAISGTTATINVEAVDSGSGGNTNTGEELTLSTPIVGINNACTVDSGGLTGGIDVESDADLRERILARIQTPPAGGADHDYINESEKVAGVSRAFVYGNYNVLVQTFGHVTVVIVGSDTLVPSSAVLTAVENALTDADTGIVPVTATLHVEPIVAATIDIDLSITPNTAAMQAAIDASVESLLLLEAEPGGTILLSHLRNAIATSGVTDYEITDIQVDTVSIGVADISLSDYDYHVFGTITYSAL